MTPSELLHSRSGHWIRRCLRISALSVVAWLILELILPVTRNYLSDLSCAYSPAFIGVVAWVATAILFYVAIDVLHVRTGQWRSICRYPPLWLAAPLACALAAVSEDFLPSIRTQPVSSDWQPIYPLAFVPVALGVAVLFRSLLGGRSAKQPGPDSTTHEGRISPQNVTTWFSSGERPITSGDRDLFDHQSIANRIAHTVGVDGRPVALLGGFGTGKTSILSLSRTQIDRSTPTVIVATFNAGAVPSPADIPRVALNRIIAALDDHIDTLELRNLPMTYQRLVAAEPTGRVARIFGLEPSTDSIEVVDRLTPLLDVLNARLVLIVEDLERAGRAFDARHLARLLWALRQVERASFILAVDTDHADIDVWKICDTIERVPAVNVEHTRTIVSAAYDHWLTAFSYTDPRQGHYEGGKLQLTHTLKDRLRDNIQAQAGDSPLDAIVSLLQTPRALKHVLRRVDRTWRNLNGEAELDDIIIISVLRHAAEPTLEFLNGAIDAARQEPNALAPRSKTVRDEWDKLIGEMPNGAAVQRLVGLLGIRQLTTGAAIDVNSSPQGVHVGHPTDYFSRISAEVLAPEELRDQTVLGNIQRWQASRDDALTDNLVAASEGSEQYARVWQHFSFLHSDAELMELAGAVVARVLERDGSAAAGDHNSIIALCLACSRRPQEGQFKDWIQDLILSAVPMSLHMAIDLYYYWTGNHGVVPDTQRGIIRRAIVEAVRDSIRTSEDLARALATKHPYTVMRLITQTDVDTTVSAYEPWRHYLPPLLIDGAKHDPEIIIPELANLAGDEQSGHRALGPQYPPVFVRRYKVDRERMKVLFGERLDEALSLLAEYDGDNPYAVRAKEDAKSWVRERRSQQ